MSHVVPLMIGTAGHVDHGKTTLLQRLAGGAPDADRLPEERSRGLTIDIGYAELDLGDGRQVGVVDVPGHEKFVRNMVAAASGIDLVLLVVAADDGVMPQTREHLEIADLLGATTGLVALTKIDLVDEELAELAAEDVRDLTAGTFLADAPVIKVSGETGQGIDELRAALVKQLDEAEPRPPEGIFRLPVQRGFLSPGHGTIVTGVPLAGRVAIGDTLEVVPGNRKCRVRAIQAYHREVEEGRAGHRTALKLSDVSWKEVGRGDVVAEPGYLREANLVEVRFGLLSRRGKKLVSNTPIRFHTGTSEVLGRLFLLDKRELAPGEDGLAQLRLDRPVVAAPGDRFVLRAPSPQVTLGGGRIIGFSRSKLTAGRTRLVKRVAMRESGLDDLEKAIRFAIRTSKLRAVSPADLAKETFRRPEEIRGILSAAIEEGAVVAVGDRLLDAEIIEKGRRRLVEALARYHEREPLRSAAGRPRVRDELDVGEAVLDVLISGAPEVVKVEGGRLRLRGFAPRLSDLQKQRRDRILELLSEDRFTPPREAEFAGLIEANPAEVAKLVDLLVDEGEARRIGDGILLLTEALEEAKARIRAFLKREKSLAPADLKQLLGMSRKYSIPLLEWLDACRFTVRRGDRRELG